MRARLRWQAASSAVPGLAYSVVLDGRVVKRGLRRRSYRPRPALLGSGVRRAQVMATDGLGQQIVSPTVRLRVDGQAPRVSLSVRPARGAATVRLDDPDSGLRRASSSLSFGDGSRARGGVVFHHSYLRPGRYAIVVRAADEVGNRVVRRFAAVIR